MISMALGWMVGTGIALLFIGTVSPFTGIMLIILGILGFIDHFGGMR
jgi:hypothetical protein